jgi:hypothetical protein
LVLDVVLGRLDETFTAAPTKIVEDSFKVGRAQ